MKKARVLESEVMNQSLSAIAPHIPKYSRRLSWVSAAVMPLAIALALCLNVKVPVQAVESLAQKSPGVNQPTTKPAAEKQPKPPQKDEFPPSPLELTTPDPLLPQGLKTPLSAVERQRLSVALDDLNAQAGARLIAGDAIGAFELWNRELRLRRALGLLEEIKALGRVGDEAWKQNQPTEVREITKRLQAIQTQIQPSNSKQAAQVVAERPQILQELGLAYQQVRSPGLAVSIYEGMLAEARQRKNASEEVALLGTIGQLHLSWFDYPKAVATYTDLLNVSKARGDRENEVVSISQLAYTHEQAKQPGQAVLYQQQLVGFYQNSQQSLLVPALKIRIADNYAASEQVSLAEQSYQEAFTSAQALFQLAYAADALRKLGALYLKNDRLEAALKIYEYLASVEQQAYDVYGIMNAYDQIGKIQLKRKAYPEAAIAFGRGLELAKQINHRTDYFTNQIQLAQKNAR